jgi:glyoxylase-like metal-dependent hydrolase (beta-lactamase superfamily II)
VTIGTARIEAMATPGHTDESTSYVINDAAVCTGDTLFTNGVGRPDLNAESASRRAGDLWDSLVRLQQRPEATVLLPAHASEPIAFDGRPIAARIGRCVGVAVRMDRIRAGLCRAGDGESATDAARLRAHRRPE